MSTTPTIVLVHGAFADAASWAPVTSLLLEQGHAVRVPPVYNRSLSADAASVRAFVEQIDGPVLLAGHSYGGAVITVAGVAENVVGLVYVAGYALDEGESLGQLQGGFPDSDLAANLGLTPSSEGQVIHLRIPELNEERRKELVKVAHKYAETAKVAVRHVRRDGMDALKKMEKDHQISQDDHKRMDTEVQKTTDQAILDIDHLLSAKEKEIMTV